jgi:hypothetical protein
VARSGALALIASGGTTLSVVDLTTPAAPSIVGTLWTPDYVSSAAFLDDGRHAIVTCATFSYPNILCVDLTVPSAPAIVGRTAIPGLSLPFDAVIRGSYAYVGVQGAHGLSVVNVSNPASPVEVSQVIVNWQAGAIAREDHYVYLAGDSLLVLDVTVPANPVRIGVVDLPWPVARATASQGMVYVSAAGGVMIVDVTDPANPVARGQRSTPGAALGVDADSEYVFLAHIAILSSERRFTILPRQCSAVTTVEAGMPGAATPGLAADPNPFREMVSLHIDAVGGPGGVIEIFDARGRRVRSLSRAAGAPAGTPLTWDGRDATGAAVASGVYFARLEWGGRSAITRLILAR